MAKAQIGAVISIKGASDYNKAIRNITRVTKEMESEIKATESAFNSEYKTIRDLKALKEKLSTAVGGYTQKLSLQKEAQEEMNNKLEFAEKRSRLLQERIDNLTRSSSENTEGLKEANQLYTENQTEMDKLTNATIDMNTAINDTTAKLNEHKQAIKDLPTSYELLRDAVKNTTDVLGEDLVKLGGNITKYVTLPIVGGFTASVKTAADFQSSFTGVKKTVNGTKSELEGLRRELEQIPLETASSNAEVMAVAEAAGQLNVPIDQIAEFTKYVIMLGDTTNITAEEGATSIARFMNIMGVNLKEGVDDVSRFESSLVALGNNTATDEASILSLAMRLASAGRMAGMSIPEILGLSAAMSAVGLTAEAGGTAMSTTMNMITTAIADGGDRLQIFADLTGKTTEEFAESWRTDAIGTIEDLLNAFANLDGGSEEMLQLMDELGWAGIRQSDAWRRLTLNTKGVSDAVDIANKNFETDNEALYDQNALTEEANKRYADFNSQVSQLKESIKLFASRIGDQLIPMLLPVIEKITEWFKGMAELDENTLKVIGVIGGLIAIIGPLITAWGLARIALAKYKAANDVLKGAEGVGGLIAKITGEGGLVPSLKTLASTVTDKVIPTITDTVPGALGFTLLTLAGCFMGAKTAAEEMDKKMHESAEACEYVAKRYHWSEEKVNEFGYTWDENGHLVELANDKISTSTSETSLEVMQEMWKARQEAKTTTEGAIDDVTQAIEYRIPEVQSTSHKMVDTGVDEMRSAAGSAYSYGSELGGNFANGISSQINNVRNAAVGIARAVQTYLHFSEPDAGPLSDFNSWMPDMMSQMAQGINDNIYMVESAMQNLTGSMANNLTGGNGQGMNVTINVSGNNMDAMQVANLVEQRLTDKVRRVKYAY